MSRALEDWAYQRGVQLDFIRPGKPVENAFIESWFMSAFVRATKARPATGDSLRPELPFITRPNRAATRRARTAPFRASCFLDGSPPVAAIKIAPRAS
jgi:transposase InsO family protein